MYVSSRRSSLQKHWKEGNNFDYNYKEPDRNKLKKKSHVVIWGTKIGLAFQF